MRMNKFQISSKLKENKDRTIFTQLTDSISSYIIEKLWKYNVVAVI